MLFHVSFVHQNTCRGIQRQTCLFVAWYAGHNLHMSLGLLSYGGVVSQCACSIDFFIDLVRKFPSLSLFIASRLNTRSGFYGRFSIRMNFFSLKKSFILVAVELLFNSCSTFSRASVSHCPQSTQFYQTPHLLWSYFIE